MTNTGTDQRGTHSKPKDIAAMVAAAIPFVFALLLAIRAWSSGDVVIFATAWPLMQLGGYAMTLQMAKGRFASAPVISQIAIHWIIMILFLVLATRVS